MSSRLQNNAGKSGAKRDPRSAGQGREVENQVGLEFAGVGQCIAEDKASFGIGVVDLDSECRRACG